MVMTVQCPECGTEFPVDPAKVPEEGVRAQCSVCPGVFPVFRPEGWSPTEAAEDAAVSVVEEAAPVAGGLDVQTDLPEYGAGPEGQGLAASEEESRVQEGELLEDGDEVVEAEFQTEEEYREGIELDSALEYGGSVALEEEAVLEEVRDRPDEVADVEWVEEAAETETQEVEAEYAWPEEVEVAEPYAGEREVSEYEEVPATPEMVPETPSAPTPEPIQFGHRDPKDKARRLARVLVSDMIVYHRDRHERSLAAGTLKEEFQEEIQKSWDEYVEQVGGELAASTPYFTEALNEILARGEQIF
jgi:predicted Zn finger-like uncharacterized protein